MCLRTGRLRSSLRWVALHFASALWGPLGAGVSGIPLAVCVAAGLGGGCPDPGSAPFCVCPDAGSAVFAFLVEPYTVGSAKAYAFSIVI